VHSKIDRLNQIAQGHGLRVTDPMGLSQGGLPLDFGAYVSIPVEDLAQESVDLPLSLHHLPPADKGAPVLATLTRLPHAHRLALPGYYLDDMESRNNNIATVCIWLSMLGPDDTVEIFTRSGRALIGVGGGYDYLGYYIPIINAIHTCKAKTVFVLDHYLASYEPYLAMACREVQLREYGSFILTPDVGMRNESPRDLVLQPFFTQLLERGVTLELLRPEDVDTVRSQKSLIVQQKTLRSRIAIVETHDVDTAVVPSDKTSELARSLDTPTPPTTTIANPDAKPVVTPQLY